MTAQPPITIPAGPASRILAALKTQAGSSAPGTIRSEAAELAQLVSDAMNAAAMDTFEAAAARIVVEDKTELGQLRELASKLAPYAAPEIRAAQAMQALDRMNSDIANYRQSVDKRINRESFEHIASRMLAHMLRFNEDHTGAFNLGVYEFETATHTDPDDVAF